MDSPAETPANDWTCSSENAKGAGEKVLCSVPERWVGKALCAMEASARVCFFVSEAALDPVGERRRSNIARAALVVIQIPTLR